MTLRQKRHAAALLTLERALRQRDKTLAKLVRLEAKIKSARRSVQRLEREPAKPATATPEPTPPAAAPAPVPPGPIPPAVDAAGVPDFLRSAKPKGKTKPGPEERPARSVVIASNELTRAAKRKAKPAKLA